MSHCYVASRTTRIGATSPSSTLKTTIPHHHFRVWVQYFCQAPLFQPDSRCAWPQCAAVMDVYRDHLLHCERGTHRIARHDEQVRFLVGDLSKAAHHPVLEPRPLGRHRERPDIRAISRHDGSDLFDITFCHPLTPARIRDTIQNPLSILKAAWSTKSARYASVLEAYGTTVYLIPVPISTLGGWHPDSYRAMGSVVSLIASRALSCLSAARSILFQRPTALLVIKTNPERAYGKAQSRGGDANTVLEVVSGFLLYGMSVSLEQCVFMLEGK